MASYSQPQVLKKWVRDVPGGELYELFVRDDRTVWMATGRFAHSSGATHCSWEQFLAGQLDSVAAHGVGSEALAAAKQFVGTFIPQVS